VLQINDGAVLWNTAREIEFGLCGVGLCAMPKDIAVANGKRVRDSAELGN
jgi:hypothetical protein